MRKSSIIVIIFLVLAVCAIGVQFASTYQEYSRYNINWNGTSDFFAGAQQQYIYDYADLEKLQNTSLLIIAPSAEFNDGAGYLRDYISRGNRVIIADQHGFANEVLKSVGSDIRVSGILGKSAMMEHNDTGLFYGYVIENETIFGNIGDKIFVNYPSYVTGGTPVLISSVFSWEVGENFTEDFVDMKVYSLAAYNTIGNGKILIIADPSIFINSMQGSQYKNNRAFLDRLQATSDMYLEQKFSSSAKGGGIFGILPMLMRYPVLTATLIAIFSMGFGAFLLKFDRKKRR